MEDFSVSIPLGRVDSHVRREVEEGLLGDVMRANVRQRSVPEEKRGRRSILDPKRAGMDAGDRDAHRVNMHFRRKSQLLK